MQILDVYRLRVKKRKRKKNSVFVVHILINLLLKHARLTWVRPYYSSYLPIVFLYYTFDNNNNNDNKSKNINYEGKIQCRTLITKCISNVKKSTMSINQKFSSEFYYTILTSVTRKSDLFFLAKFYTCPLKTVYFRNGCTA